MSDIKRILIIDDSPINIKAATKFLEDAPNLEILSASNGAEGISIFLDKDIDLIFLDINMEGLSGYETCLLIKSNTAKSVPVIMVSSNDGVFDALKGKQYLADDYITKPYTKEALLEMFKKHLR